jgi:hypothetical protein
VTQAVSVLEVALRAGTLLVFPALAGWARRTGGPARLWGLTGLGVALVLLFALFVASPLAGNALVGTYGYRDTALRSLALHGLTFGLPLVATAAVVHGFAGHLASRGALYAIGLLGAVVGWVLGVLAAIKVLVALA